MSPVACLQETEPTREEKFQQLERVLADRRFRSSERNASFLRYIVEKAIDGKASEIKEIVIAMELYGRTSDYDPKVDSVVRVEASRLRSKLQSYYEQEGRFDPIRINVPKGGYVPQFEWVAVSGEQSEEPEPPVAAAEPPGMDVSPLPPRKFRFPPVLLWMLILELGLLISLWGWHRYNDQPGATAPPPEALIAWQEGNELLRQDPNNALPEHGAPQILERAIERYEFTVTKAPRFAKGWASLAEAYEYAFPYVGRDPALDQKRAEAAALRAVSLDSRLAAGHAMLALVRFYLQWDFAGAEAAYRRALELDPRNVYAVVEYADLLRETGRVELAAAEVRKARALQPALPILAIKEAEIHLDQHQPDAAITAATAAIRLTHDYRAAHVALGMALEVKGELEPALARYRKALEMHGLDRRALPAYGYLLGRMGRTKEAKAVIRQLEDMNSRIRNCAFQVAVVYSGLGEHEQVIDWLERAYRTHQVHLPFAAVDYRFQPLHRDPRFQAILGRLGLKPLHS